MIKAIFFDIDGTLISFDTHRIPESTMRTLQQLKDNGILLFIATGRSKDGLDVLEDFPFDGYVTMNGQYCYEQNGTVVYENTIARKELLLLKQELKKRPFPCGFEMTDGKIFNYRLSILYSKAILFLSRLTLPITYLVSGFGTLVTKPLVKNIKDIEISEDDLHEMVEGIEKQGMVDQEKATLLHETIRYTHTEAYEVMTPRVDMFAIDIDDDLEEILDDPKTYKFSRVPVYQGTIDNIIGYVKTRYLMAKKIKGEEFTLVDLLQKPLRFPRSTEINDILKAFKKQKRHFALVMDEYGGVEGLITMEDILEEIVGEIWDEKDDPERPYIRRKDGSYIVDGSLTLEDFCDLFHIDYEKTDTEYVTIGGYIIELLDDHFANVGDTCRFENLEIKVLAVDKNAAVEKILVTPIKEEEDKDEAE